MYKLITLPFDDISQNFPEEILNQFLSNKHIIKIKSKFFKQDGQAYWSFFIEYDLVMKPHENPKPKIQLTEPQEKLLTELQHWRKTKAQTEDVSHYVIATNKQLEDVVLTLPTTHGALRLISGFGSKKVKQHGDEIIKRVKPFCEPPNETKNKTE